MFQLIRLIILAIRGIQRVSIPTEPALRYKKGIERYNKAFFDEDYQFQFYKYPLGDLPVEIEYYHLLIGHITLMKKGSTTFFEVYETNVISEKELAMNIRLSYADFEITGLTSQKQSVVTQNQFFVLYINDRLKQLEVRSSIDVDITEKMVKKDFGEYLVKYILKERAEQESLPLS